MRVEPGTTSRRASIQPRRERLSFDVKGKRAQPNARHHPRPHPTCMRDFVAGRRVHAVVGRRHTRKGLSFNFFYLH